MNIRPIQPEDKAILAESLAKSQYHSDIPVDFFYDARAICNVYEEDSKPIFWVRGTKAIRLYIQFNSDGDFRNNRKALLEGFPSFVEQARNAGFTELIFSSESPLLISFCKKHFSFEDSAGELRRIL